MVRSITSSQILSKLSRFIDSAFGTLARDRLKLVEIGPSIQFDTMHLPKAIHINEEQVKYEFHRRFLSKGEEIILYGKRDQAKNLYSIADSLFYDGFFNIYVYSEGKERWFLEGLGMETSLVPADGFHSEKVVSIQRGSSGSQLSYLKSA
jgi:hypothetical protein